MDPKTTLMKKSFFLLIISLFFLHPFTGEANPMGKTWVVFIQNTNYLSLSTLAGAQKDVSLMKEALSSYQIDKIIIKQDLKKGEMQKFFSADLPALLKENGVNSLLIWYSGHGKFINETGYWIPVDAQRDDEATYYRMESLKKDLERMVDHLQHVLVVTDACESGPTFFQAMRSIPTKPVCDDPVAAKKRSYQLFSASGYNLANEESLFARTIAGALSDNPKPCIPVQEVVKKVTITLMRNHLDRPQFGNITGMDSEGGTFFFYKK